MKVDDIVQLVRLYLETKYGDLIEYHKFKVNDLSLSTLESAISEIGKEDLTLAILLKILTQVSIVAAWY